MRRGRQLEAMLDIPVLGARCCWVLMSSLEDEVKWCRVNVSETGSQVEDLKQSCLFNNGEKFVSPRSTQAF